MYYARRKGRIHLPKLHKRVLIMEEKIKELISGYIKTDISKIDYSTLIDRNAVSNSILLHRMYA